MFGYRIKQLQGENVMKLNFELNKTHEDYQVVYTCPKCGNVHVLKSHIKNATDAEKDLYKRVWFTPYRKCKSCRYYDDVPNFNLNIIRRVRC